VMRREETGEVVAGKRSQEAGCAETDENVEHRFSKNRTEPTSKFKNRKLGFCGSVLKN